MLLELINFCIPSGIIVVGYCHSLIREWFWNGNTAESGKLVMLEHTPASLTTYDLICIFELFLFATPLQSPKTPLLIPADTSQSHNPSEYHVSFHRYLPSPIQHNNINLLLNHNSNSTAQHSATDQRFLVRDI